MGLIILDSIMTNYGVSVSNTYLTMNGHYNIMKINYRKEILGQPVDSVCYKIVGNAMLWFNKESINQGIRPLNDGIMIEVNDVSKEDLEKQGGILKNILYPKLIEMLGINNFHIDD
jgi:hypothetical protein